MNTKFKPHTGFVLAAGKGTRLRPYTDQCPKPLVSVGGLPMIDHALNHLHDNGVNHAVVNLHYLAPLLRKHLEDRDFPQLSFSHEDELLDTGGGIKKALSMVGDDPFFVVSGDSVWEDGVGDSALSRLSEAWNPDIMDILILLQPCSRMTLTHSVGDYDLDHEGKAIRSLDQNGEYMWTSIRLCKASLFNDSPDGAFSFLTLLDKAQEQGRLYGLVHDGEWHHISTPSDLERVNAHYTGQRPSKRA